MSIRRSSSERGGALLTVLWLAAALAAIGFAIASTVRAETERTATATEGAKAYFLAAGGIDRAMLHIEWGLQTPPGPDGINPYFTVGQRMMILPFPTGIVAAEVIPEAAKLNVNNITPPELQRLLGALGAPPDRALLVTRAILDWRQPAIGGLTEFDQAYLARVPSFRSRHASFEEIEEILALQGVTPELYYGSYERDQTGRLVARSGLRDCLSIFGSATQVDVNYADAATLQAIGLGPQEAAAVVQLRQRIPIRTPQQLALLTQAGGPAWGRLRVGGGTILTIRSTARLRPDARGPLSDLRRTVAATVKLYPAGTVPPYQILRWYDNEWVAEGNQP